MSHATTKDGGRLSVTSAIERLGLIGFMSGCLSTIYVLSYGPYLRMGQSDALDTFYRPADWMLMETPLQKPMLWWGDVTGSREEMEVRIDPARLWHLNFSPRFLSEEAQSTERDLGLKYE